VTNGWGLVRKNSFMRLNISEDETVILGECKGSGADNYMVSADFIHPGSPVFRCTCPSRQFPCKHALGLLYAYAGGKQFTPVEIPRDIYEKREKAEKREEKKKTDEQSEPKKVNKSALAKKIKAQLEGLELLEKITNSIAQSGLGTMNAKTLQVLEEQAKQLGNHYIPGAQTALRELIVLFQGVENPEGIYTEAIDCLTRLYSLCKKGKEYLNKRLENPEMPLDASSTMEEWLGYAWQLSELKSYGLVQMEVELVQLSFNSYSDEARQEYVDAGLWLNLKTGQIQETRIYRPYRAAKYIREEDSFFSVMQVKELFVYPGDMNPRIRWESVEAREITGRDYDLIRSHAQKSYPEVIKSIKNQIKNPLAAKDPVVLLQYARIGQMDDDIVMENLEGQRIVLEDLPSGFEPKCTHLLRLLPCDVLQGQAVLVRFHHDMDSKRLYAQPLSIVTNDRVIRLVF
jgi:hypothetical protein